MMKDLVALCSTSQASISLYKRMSGLCNKIGSAFFPFVQTYRCLVSPTESSLDPQGPAQQVK